MSSVNGSPRILAAPRYSVYRSGRKRPLDGFDVVDTAHPMPILVAWCHTRQQADELTARLARGPAPTFGRFPVTRHVDLVDGAEYQVCDELTGQPLYFGPSAKAALDRSVQAEKDAVPAEAHASIDGTFPHPDDDIDDEASGPWRDDDVITLAAFEAAVEDTFEADMDQLGAMAEHDDPLPLPAALRLEADVLATTGVLGPNARRVIANLIREAATVAQATGARTVAQMVAKD